MHPSRRRAPDGPSLIGRAITSADECRPAHTQGATSCRKIPQRRMLSETLPIYFSAALLWRGRRCSRPVSKGAPSGRPGRLTHWLLPATAAGLGVVSLGLIFGGCCSGEGASIGGDPETSIVTALVVGADLAWWQWGRAVMLHLGPSDLAAMMACALSIAVASCSAISASCRRHGLGRSLAC